jgi:4-amino-4-deoxy-L-arabinose transferase-like glycosyltransferase
MNAGAMPEHRLLTRLAHRPVPVLVLLCLLAWLPGFFALPPLDRDESRFAQASKQMIETGDYVDIRFSTVPRYNKPVGIYWLQSAATRALGQPPYNRIWTYRLPSLLGGLLAVLLTFWCARAFVGPETAFVAAALLGLTALLTGEAEIATTDAALLATIVAAQGVLARAYLFARGQLEKAPSLGVALGGWAAAGIGILLKGPVILAVLALTAVSLSLWDREWRWLRGTRGEFGIPLAIAIVLPWAIAIALASHGAFYQRSLGHDFAAKILGGQETHGAPPGYYLALATVTLWPATLFALPSIGQAIADRAQPALRFLLAWIVPNWLMFELVPTKLPHYILPVYSAVAILTAIRLTVPHQRPEQGLQRILRMVSILLFAIVGLAVIAATFIIPARLGASLPVWMMCAAMAIAGVILIAAVLAIKQRYAAGAIAACVAAIVLYPLLAAGVAPRLAPLWMSNSIAVHLAKLHVPAEPSPILAGYVEPSTVFLLGTDTRLGSGATAGREAAQRGGIAAVEDHERKRFLDALHAAHGHERAVDQLSGFDYSRGHNVHVTLYRVTPAGPDIAPPPK